MECVPRLMSEHRLVEEMVARLRRELHLLKGGGQARQTFLDAAAEFFVSFVERLHHGNEQLLFDAIGSHEVSPDHRRLLKEEHGRSRDLVAGLVDAGGRAAAGDEAAAVALRASLAALVELYPLHIAKEDAHIMLALKRYFTTEERQRLDAEFDAFEGRVNLANYAALLERGWGG